jgi:hypothetical protein
LSLILYVNIIKAGERYLPSKSSISGEFLQQVDDLLEDVSTIQPPLKTRGLGISIFRNLAPSTVIVRTAESFGSGILISYDGKIITNHHVIEKDDNSISSEVELVFCPVDLDHLKNTAVYKARVVLVDKTRDLALLQMYSPVDNQISKVANLEINKSSVQVGMDVHAIGHPEGEFCTYTQGVTSRIISDYDWSYSSTSVHKANVIQTQTPINPGNSGGPLISDMGKVIGINTFKHPSAVGINFAVSATEINDFLINGSVPPIPPSIPDCSEDEPVIEHDDNNNGIIDTYGFDFNCNGYAEIIYFDEDEDGEPDILYIDTDENETDDLFITFVDYEGSVIGVFEYDENEDGIIEKECADFDNDGNPDECRNVG